MKRQRASQLPRADQARNVRLPKEYRDCWSNSPITQFERSKNTAAITELNAIIFFSREPDIIISFTNQLHFYPNIPLLFMEGNRCTPEKDFLHYMLGRFIKNVQCVSLLFRIFTPNFEALVAALHVIDGQTIDEIICLGDTVGYGANPNECVALVRQRCRFVHQKGNHEARLSSTSHATESLRKMHALLHSGRASN